MPWQGPALVRNFVVSMGGEAHDAHEHEVQIAHPGSMGMLLPLGRDTVLFVRRMRKRAIYALVMLGVAVLALWAAVRSST